jgi:phosphatidylserine/phosphatidylglycerophosphate/cardiolipin synthase-like enzyme
VAAPQRGVAITLAVSSPTSSFQTLICALLWPLPRIRPVLPEKKKKKKQGFLVLIFSPFSFFVGFARRRIVFVNLTKVFGSGVQHAKFMIVDNTNFYVGSANLVSATSGYI